MLEWARKRLGMPEAQAAARIGIPPDRLASWESGATKPPFGAVSKMASSYGVPIALFFMPHPPETSLFAAPLPTDYRLAPETEGSAVRTRDLSVAVRATRTWRAGLLRFDSVEQASVPETSRHADPDSVGALVRELCQVDDERQLAWSTTENALEGWRQGVEFQGVLVFSLFAAPVQLTRDVCRGFSLWEDGVFPIVALAIESEQARAFTLLHEYAHLMLRAGGTCLTNEDGTQRGLVERFCNRVAAAALMPTSIISSVIGDSPPEVTEWTRDDLRPYAQAMKVSLEALAIRLENLGYAPDGTFEAVHAEALAGEPERWRRRGGGGGTNPWPSPRIAERGALYSIRVHDAWSEGRLSLADASRLLNLNPKYLPEVPSRIEARRARLG